MELGQQLKGYIPCHVELDIQIGMEILTTIVMVKTIVITMLTSSETCLNSFCNQIGNNP